MTEKYILEQWHRYAATQSGIIGGALRTQRAKAFLVQEQQRAIIGIQEEAYDVLWLRLQAMLLPRPDQFTTDLARIVAKVQHDLRIVADLDLQRLGELIHAGLDDPGTP